MDHLLDLDEEFDLANSAASALEVEAGADARSLREMIADPGRDLANFLDHSEVERTAPHERLNRIKKSLAKRDVARCRTGTDESGSFPR